jgi:hypothetical protein
MSFQSGHVLADTETEFDRFSARAQKPEEEKGAWEAATISVTHHRRQIDQRD